MIAMSGEVAARIAAEASALTSAEIAETVRSLLGAKLTAYVCGASSTQAVRAWIDQEAPVDAAITSRLQCAYRCAVLMVEAGEAEGTVQAWFQGANPELGGRAPARVLRDLADRAYDGADLLAAAHAFVAT